MTFISGGDFIVIKLNFESNLKTNTPCFSRKKKPMHCSLFTTSRNLAFNPTWTGLFLILAEPGGGAKIAPLDISRLAQLFFMKIGTKVPCYERKKIQKNFFPKIALTRDDVTFSFRICVKICKKW